MALAEKSERTVRPRAATSRNVARQKAPRKSRNLDNDRNGVCGIRLYAADAHLLWAQPELHALTFRTCAEPLTSEHHRADLHPIGTGNHRVEQVHLADEIGNEGAARTAVDLRCASDLLDATVVHHHDLVGHRHRLLLVVGDHDGGDAEAPLQRLDLVAQAHAHPRIERRQRLIEQQERGRGCQRASQRHALLLAARQLCRILVALLRHADELQKLGDTGRNLAARLAPVDEAITHVPRHSQIGKQRIGLKDDAEVALRRRQARHVAAADLDCARVLHLEAGDHPQQSGLAAARRPQEADELAALHLERDVIERGEGAEALGGALDSEMDGTGGRGSSCGIDPVDDLISAVGRGPPSPLRGGVGGGG